MSVKLTKLANQLLNDPETSKVLATVDGDGVPHVVTKGSIQAGPDGNIHVLQGLEFSTTARNLVRSIWFDRKVAIGLRGKDGQSIQIKGRPIANHITGPLFQEHYVKLRERRGDTDLAGVWVIAPEEIIDETPGRRIAEEQERHPYVLHLDRIAKVA
jgi:predicted pyridoxine 5'-phosphate oxidase superfamily flavin-nucleotide-binding protein